MGFAVNSRIVMAQIPHTYKQTNKTHGFIQNDAICHSFARFVQHFAIIHFAHFQPQWHTHTHPCTQWVRVLQYWLLAIMWHTLYYYILLVRYSAVHCWHAIVGPIWAHTVTAIKNYMFIFKDVCHLVWYYRWQQKRVCVYEDRRNCKSGSEWKPFI